MAGKSRNSGKPDGRGGKRAGSGRKPKEQPDYDGSFKESILKAAAKLAEEKGKPIEEAVLGMIYDANVQDSVKASIWKSLLEVFTVKKTEQSVTKTELPGPAIGLPAMRKDPALQVVSGGKK